MAVGSGHSQSTESLDAGSTIQEAFPNNQRGREPKAYRDNRTARMLKQVHRPEIGVRFGLRNTTVGHGPRRSPGEGVFGPPFFEMFDSYQKRRAVYRA